MGYELEAQDENGNTIAKFNSNATITFAYTDEQLKELGITEESLVSKYYDEQTGTWKDPNGVTQDTEKNTITISTNHFTKFCRRGGRGSQCGKSQNNRGGDGGKRRAGSVNLGCGRKKIKSFWFIRAISAAKSMCALEILTVTVKMKSWPCRE